MSRGVRSICLLFVSCVRNQQGPATPSGFLRYLVTCCFLRKGISQGPFCPETRETRSVLLFMYISTRHAYLSKHKCTSVRGTILPASSTWSRRSVNICLNVPLRNHAGSETQEDTNGDLRIQPRDIRWANILKLHLAQITWVEYVLWSPVNHVCLFFVIVAWLKDPLPLSHIKAVKMSKMALLKLCVFPG